MRNVTFNFSGAKRVGFLAGIAITAGWSLTACGGSSDTTSSGSGGSAASCVDLVGKKVDAKATCGNFDSPGSSGCYVNGKRHGLFYYFGDADAMVYGKPGGTWQKGPSSISISQMAKKIGC